MKNFRSSTVLHTIMVVLVSFLITAGCATFEKQSKPSAVTDRLPGYLASTALPDSEALLPPPPAPGSAALALDHDISRASLALQDSPRFMLASVDADLKFPRAASVFSCALNIPISEQGTPRLYDLLRRIRTDASHATYKAKDKYVRTRPFVENKQRTCSPDDEKSLRKNGSYPSGHSSIGWAWALALAELAPDRADAILARGRAFGQNRVICNVHWQSDVLEGIFIGSVTIARLHGDPAFRADLEAVRGELTAVRAKGLKPARDCKAEADALAQYPPLASWPADK
jgi:acid phosphatase (class A)